MRYDIKMELSVSGVQDVIKQLEAYRDQTIPQKVVKVRQAVAETIRSLADEDYRSALFKVWSIVNREVSLESWSPDISVRVEQDGQRTLVVASGGDVLFVEFGTGVHYNGAVGSSPHPWGSENNMLIGTYGLGNGAKDTWRFMSNGKRYFTHGIASNQSLYMACQAVAVTLGNVARGAWDS